MPRFDWLKWGVAVAVGASLVGVAAWQAGSLAVGLVLSGGFVAIAFVLHLAGVALVRAVQPLRTARSFALRQAVLRVARPGNQTRIILLAVGLGTFFILGVRALQANLLQDFSLQMGEDAPDMFLMDIQPAQRDGVTGAHRSRERRRGCAEADSRAARAHRRRARPRRQPRELRGRARAGAACRASSPSPTGRISRPTRSSSTARGGTPGRPETMPEVSIEEGLRDRGSRSSSATRCASTCSAASSRRASPASAKWTFATSAPAAS